MSTNHYLLIPISPTLPAWVIPKGEAKMWKDIDTHLSLCHEYHDAYMIISEASYPDLFKYLQS